MNGCDDWGGGGEDWPQEWVQSRHEEKRVTRQNGGREVVTAFQFDFTEF
jgi:hypothetical protein